jgi:hypothetical protein
MSRESLDEFPRAFTCLFRAVPKIGQLELTYPHDVSRTIHSTPCVATRQRTVSLF